MDMVGIRRAGRNAAKRELVSDVNLELEKVRRSAALLLSNVVGMSGYVDRLDWARIVQQRRAIDDCVWEINEALKRATGKIGDLAEVTVLASLEEDAS